MKYELSLTGGTFAPCGGRRNLIHRLRARGTSSVSAARCRGATGACTRNGQLPQRGSLLSECDDLPSPLGRP